VSQENDGNAGRGENPFGFRRAALANHWIALFWL
jgi:hypothetical protein